MKCIEIDEEKNCCGCRGCENICPKKAIHMEENKEGFLYPIIDKNKCVGCGLCRKVCPILNDLDRTEYYESPICYAAKTINIDLQTKSSSGGLFGTFAGHILRNGGIVVGCEMDDKHKVMHTIVEKEEDLEKVMGSKYVLSDLNNIFTRIKEELRKGRLVLFSGTPCQVSSLLMFLNKKYDNLYTIEVICHGVPPQKLFTKYIEYLEKKYDAKLEKFYFRSKQAAKWGTYKALANFVRTKDGQEQCKFSKKINADFDPYYWSFLYCKNYRRSCYSCKFAQPKRNADLTLGDFWGIEKIMPDMIDYNGVSIVVINSPKGKELLDKNVKKLIIKKVDYDTICQNNGQLRKPSEMPPERNNWYKNIDDGDFIENIIVKPNLRSYVKILFPQSLKFKIKKILKKK